MSDATRPSGEVATRTLIDIKPESRSTIAFFLRIAGEKFDANAKQIRDELERLVRRSKVIPGNCTAAYEQLVRLMDNQATEAREWANAIEYSQRVFIEPDPGESVDNALSRELEREAEGGA